MLFVSLLRSRPFALSLARRSSIHSDPCHPHSLNYCQSPLKFPTPVIPTHYNHSPWLVRSPSEHGSSAPPTHTYHCRRSPRLHHNQPLANQIPPSYPCHHTHSLTTPTHLGSSKVPPHMIVMPHRVPGQRDGPRVPGGCCDGLLEHGERGFQPVVGGVY
jgi:hypothetical protein